MRVLIIDDDPFALQLLQRQLRMLGIATPQTCASGAGALDLMSRADTPFDVLLVDLNMPGMDGVEFLRHLARQRFRGGLVLVSGEDERILQSVRRLAEAHRLRVLGALPKPVLPQQLAQVLRDPGTQVPRAAGADAQVSYGAADVAAAIRDGQITVHYQPQVSLADGAVDGVEALARWAHPRDGLVPPARFVPVAERGGLAAALARAVLVQALSDARAWRAAGLDLRLSVNVSMDTLVELAFPDEVARLADGAGMAAHGLVLEVTESQLPPDPQALLDIASRLRLKRIGLSIDDFGTGYSSLAQLRDLPFDELKLDRGFVLGAADDAALRAILEANLGMARQLGIRSVAEGIEHDADWHCLRALGCDLAQGFLVARPMAAGHVLDWAAAWNTRGRLPLKDPR